MKEILSELLELHGILLWTENREAQAAAVMVLMRIRQLLRGLAPLHAHTDAEIEHQVKMVETYVNFGKEPVPPQPPDDYIAGRTASTRPPVWRCATIKSTEK